MGRAPLLLEHYRGPARTDHQHAASGSHRDGLIIEIDPDDRVTTEPLRFLLHLSQGDLLCLSELLLIGGRSASHDVADAGEEIPEEWFSLTRESGARRERQARATSSETSASPRPPPAEIIQRISPAA